MEKISARPQLAETEPVSCRKTLWLLGCDGFPMDHVSYMHTIKAPRCKRNDRQELTLIQHSRDSPGDPVWWSWHGETSGLRQSYQHVFML